MVVLAGERPGGQDLNDVYEWGIAKYLLMAHIANTMTQDEATYYQSLYDDEI